MDHFERTSRRDTFLGTAADYFAARPGYPGSLLRRAVELGSLRSAGSILEVGCGTGEATEWFAEAGFAVRAIDRSPEMLGYARARLSRFKQVQVMEADFEVADLGTEFDGIVFATSYHWLDPETRVERVRRHLRPGGTAILLWHTHPPPFTGYFERSSELYRRHIPNWEPPPSPGMVEERLQEISAELENGGLRVLGRLLHDWERTFERDRYLQLVTTYSDFRLLDKSAQRSMLEALGALIDSEFDGAVTRPYRTIAIVAERPGDGS